MKAVVVVCVLATAAHADNKPSPPDPDTEDAAGEKNLESNAPRAGVTFSASVGAGITMGDGVGRGEAFSFRIGHVATPSSVLTLELTGGSLFHQQIGATTVYHNDYVGLMAGGLHYVSGSFWIRGAGGLATYTIDSGDTMEYTRVDLVTGNFQGVGTCDNGLHIATSAQQPAASGR